MKVAAGGRWLLNPRGSSDGCAELPLLADRKSSVVYPWIKHEFNACFHPTHIIIIIPCIKFYFYGFFNPSHYLVMCFSGDHDPKQCQPRTAPQTSVGPRAPPQNMSNLDTFWSPKINAYWWSSCRYCMILLVILSLSIYIYGITRAFRWLRDAYCLSPHSEKVIPDVSHSDPGTIAISPVNSMKFIF